MAQLRRFFAAFFLCLCAASYADELPRLVVQTTHPRTYGRVALSSDRKFFASADDDGTVKIWSVENGLLLRTLELEVGARQIAFDPKGRLVVAGAEKVVFVDVSSGKEVGRLQVARTFCTGFDFLGDKLVTGGTDGKSAEWDLDSGKKTREVVSFDQVIRAVKVSPDNSTLAVLTQDGVLHFCKTSDGQSLGDLSGFDYGSNLDFSSDGKLLAVRSQSGVAVIDVQSRKPVQTLTSGFGHDAIGFGSGTVLYYRTESGVSAVDAASGAVRQVSLFGNSGSLDFKVLLDRKTAVKTNLDDSLDLYDLSGLTLVQSFKGATGAINAVAAFGRLVATGSDDGWVRLWDSLTGRPLGNALAYRGGVSAVAFSPDGSHVYSAAADGRVLSFSANGLAKEGVLDATSMQLIGLAVAPPSEQVATLSVTGKAFLGQIGGSPTTISDQLEARSIACSSDGKTIAIGTKKGELAIFRTSGGDPKVIKDAHASTITWVGFSKDNKHIFTGGVDGYVRSWPASGGKADWSIGLDSSVFAGALSPDGATLAIGGWVQPVTLLDPKNGKKKSELPDESRNNRTLAFTGDGTKIITGGRDGATSVWDLKKNKLIARRYGMGERDWVVVDAKGRFDGTDQGLSALHWVQDNRTLPLSAFFEQFDVPNLYARLTGTKIDVEEKDDPKPPPTPKVDITTTKIQPPPSVRITTPRTDQTVEQEQTTIEVSATDEGGGIDQISLYQNGKLVSDAQRELVELSRNQGKTISKKFAVLLAPGDNVFRATAFNKDRTESASPKEVKITLKKAEAGSTLYVLSVGINDYDNDNYDLTFAKPDAAAFATDVKTRAAGIFKNIVVEQLADKEGTKAKIEAAFARITAKAKPGDAFIFFYSGHGLVTEPDDGTQGEFYLITCDVKRMLGSDDVTKLGVSAKRLKELCMAVPAQKQLIIFDACYSGGAVAEFQSRGAAEEKAIHQLSRSTGVAVMAAASPDQTATELKALGHGVFTYAILKGLSGEAAPGSGSRKVTVAGLFSYLSDIVPELTKQYRGKAQYPNTFLSGQDFPIVVVKG